MDIYLAPEQAYHFIPLFTPDVAVDRVEQKKTSLAAGTVGSLISRPKPEDIHMVALENRLEPVWQITAVAKTRYDRTRTFTVTASGPEVQGVTLLGQDFTPELKAKEGPRFSIEGVEHCEETGKASRAFHGISGNAVEFAKYQSFPKTLIVDLDQFLPEGVLVVPPQLRATAVVRKVLAEVIKPVQQAHVIHEERVDIETIDLNFLPVYALEYEWSAKGKRNVVEFDALTGEVRSGGRRLQDQFKGLITRDVFFDVTADAVGMLVPGGSIAVKLVKAVVDRGKGG